MSVLSWIKLTVCLWPLRQAVKLTGSEAYADLATEDTAPLPAADDAERPAAAPPFRLGQILAVVRHLPGRIRHGRPLRLLLRALAAALLALAVLRLIPGQPAAPVLVAGLIIWFARTGRTDLAPPPER